MVLIKFAFACAATLLVNNTNTWTAIDQRAVQIASRRCAEIYPEAPCLVKFVKLDELKYNAYCGEKK